MSGRCSRCGAAVVDLPQPFTQQDELRMRREVFVHGLAAGMAVRNPDCTPEFVASYAERLASMLFPPPDAS